MSEKGGGIKRFVLEGTDYVYPRTSNLIIRAYLERQGVADEDIRENYTPFGFSDWQTEVAAIKKFGTAGKPTAVISTINGDANVPFYKELGNQAIAATDIPVIAFSVGEEELKGIDTKPLLGHLAAWSYFQSVDAPENKAFIDKWRTYAKDTSRMTNDPMKSAYLRATSLAPTAAPENRASAPTSRRSRRQENEDGRVTPGGLDVVATDRVGESSRFAL
jgi:urea transport system substrate-binding protein